MKNAEDYQVIVADDGKIAVIISACNGLPSSHPYILYKKELTAALLYRTSADIIVLDKLHEQAMKIFENADKVVVIEADYASKTAVYDYEARIIHE